MQLVPVLEIRHGKSVHTEKKNAFVNHVVSTDPLETVNHWYALGIRRIHFVDVDAIETREPCNVDLLSKIKKSCPELCIQVIGGIVDIDSAFIWIDAGADYLVLTSKAIRNKDLLSDICVEFPGKVLVEMDSRRMNNQAEKVDEQLVDLAQSLEEEGVGGLVVTEVPESGHVTARNLLSVSHFSQSVDLPVLANGGIEKLEDIEQLLQQHSGKLSGIIIGKIVYDENFNLAIAQQMLNEYQIAS
jgi:phosphoribosylformimino-5-aminoimidazole carboxamide ribotide isomerase